MRRVAQASLVRACGASIDSSDISEAIDDMLFAGGRLNVRLLGGAQQMARAAGSTAVRLDRSLENAQAQYYQGPANDSHGGQ
jgi:hypothetical protein